MSWVVWWVSGRRRAVVVAAGREVEMMYWDFEIDVGRKVKDCFWRDGGGVVFLSRWCIVLGVHEMMMVESLWWARADPSVNH
jgi:hypothetical protein